MLRRTIQQNPSAMVTATPGLNLLQQRSHGLRSLSVTLGRCARDIGKPRAGWKRPICPSIHNHLCPNPTQPWEAQPPEFLLKVTLDAHDMFRCETSAGLDCLHAL
eukprot:5570864-Amphidinium_carterae.2